MESAAGTYGKSSYVRSRTTASLALATLAGCSFLTTRPGTDPEFFGKLEEAGQNRLLGQLGQSPSAFTREMTERGASCGDGRRNGRTVRVVCAYAKCLNGGAWLNGWQMEVDRGTVSSLKLPYYGNPSEPICDHRNPEKLKEIQQTAVKEQILSAGEAFL